MCRPTTVSIGFQRVQTWLFAVPKLRVMVGANALLGQTLRVILPGLARSSPDRPWKVRAEDCWGDFPERDKDDPLGDDDDPKKDAEMGVLARDGGHFDAQFEYGAAAFAEAACERIEREVPGLPFSVTVDGKKWFRGGVSLSCELPVLAPCDWGGRGLASCEVRQGADPFEVSVDVARRHKKGAEDGPSGLEGDLARSLTRKTRIGSLTQAEDFEQLTGDEYLAVIHADGNAVGQEAARSRSSAERSRLFHRNRVLLRRALKEAMDGVVGNGDATQVAPLTLLMLGGDDVLVVCRGSLAFRFVCDLCEQLHALQDQTDAQNFRLTLGVGVVFSRATVPFHRLHAVAEKLASSAKRLYRGMDPGQTASVVDWATYTTAWADDPTEVRARDWICVSKSDRRVLSHRPLRVLGPDLKSLQGLVKGAEKLKNASRSQLHHLVDTLRTGKAFAELAFGELSQETKDLLAMKEVGVKEVWNQQGGGTCLTSLLDLVEVLEIPRLGVRNKDGLPTEPRQALCTEDSQAQEAGHERGEAV
ncbi:MAG TPA: hypothetical protein PKE31_21085 [Pseudomonadota bacterium]|nr:hypothetical protein [Pseudomonadota bacterium]